MCSITPETVNVGSSYSHMRGTGVGCWLSDRSNCSHWSFEAAVLPINPNIYTDQWEPIVIYHSITLTGRYTTNNNGCKYFSWIRINISWWKRPLVMPWCLNIWGASTLRPRNGSVRIGVLRLRMSDIFVCLLLTLMIKLPVLMSCHRPLRHTGP